MAYSSKGLCIPPPSPHHHPSTDGDENDCTDSDDGDGGDDNEDRLLFGCDGR